MEQPLSLPQGSRSPAAIYPDVVTGWRQPCSCIYGYKKILLAEA